MEERRIVFLCDVKEGKQQFYKGEDISLPFLFASQFIRHGWAYDFHSGMKTEPQMHVSVIPHNQVINVKGEICK